jgi:phosphoribosyl 1,2-cyclic phosphodiesterase
VRGSYPAALNSHMKIGGNTSCVELCVDNKVLILDAGSGIVQCGNSLLGKNIDKEVTIMMTHYHWDHIAGLPFFVPAFIPGWKINFFGPGHSLNEVEHNISGQMQGPYFPVETESWQADIKYLKMNDHYIDYPPYKIEVFHVHHPGNTFGYRITVKDKVIVYISDNELSFIDCSNDSKSKMSDEELALIKTMQQEERDKALEHIKDADILIHDAQYTIEDYKTKRGWGHSCYLDTLEFANDAKVKNLYLYHYDPNYDDNKVEQIYSHVLKIMQNDKYKNIKCHLARENLIVDL